MFAHLFLPVVFPDINANDTVGAVVGGSVELRCPAQGGVINLFQWLDNDGGLIRSTGRFNITEDDNGVEDASILTIYPVEASDQGLYSCLITTDLVTVNSTILVVGEYREPANYF